MRSKGLQNLSPPADTVPCFRLPFPPRPDPPSHSSATFTLYLFSTSSPALGFVFVTTLYRVRNLGSPLHECYVQGSLAWRQQEKIPREESHWLLGTRRCRVMESSSFPRVRFSQRPFPARLWPYAFRTLPPPSVRSHYWRGVSNPSNGPMHRPRTPAFSSRSFSLFERVDVFVPRDWNRSNRIVGPFPTFPWYLSAKHPPHFCHGEKQEKHLLYCMW